MLAALGVVVAAAVLLFVLVLVPEGQRVSQQIDDIVLTDNQKALIEEVATMSSCDDVRYLLAHAQEVIAGDGSVDGDYYGTIYGERLKEAAEQQLDTLRCGG